MASVFPLFTQWPAIIYEDIHFGPNIYIIIWNSGMENHFLFKLNRFSIILAKKLAQKPVNYVKIAWFKKSYVKSTKIYTFFDQNVKI